MRKKTKIKQGCEGSYSLGAPMVTTTEDSVTVEVSSTVYTAHGDSRLLTTVEHSAMARRPGMPNWGPGMPKIKDLVLRAIGEARYEAEAIIEAVDEDWEDNAGTDEDEGLREGAVVPGAPALDDYMISIPNEEYASLIEAKRSAETSLAACRAALQSVPEVGAVTLPDGTVAQVRVESYAALEAIWTALGNYPYERPVTARFDDPTDGEISLEDFVAATTGIAPDMSDSTPGAEPSWEGLPEYTEGLCGDGAAILKDGSLMQITEILAELTEGAEVRALLSRLCGGDDTTIDDGGPVEPELDIDALVAKAAA